VVNFVRPTVGNINTTTPNTNGIIGGWATVGTGAPVTGITVGNEWARVDGSGNIVPYAGHLNYVTGTNIPLLVGYHVRVESPDQQRLVRERHVANPKCGEQPPTLTRSNLAKLPRAAS
jgi:hypothetical protein